MIEVRAAHPDDADALAAAHVQGWRVAYRGLFSDDYLDADAFEQERLTMWRGWTWNQSGRNHLFAGLVNGVTLGFSLSGPARGTDEHAHTDGAGEVFAFYLHPDAWGSGLASALMTRAVDQLATDGYSTAVLWVLRDNPRARRFYEREGWSPTGRTTMWAGPASASHPPEPVAEVEYGRTIAQESGTGGR